MHHKMQTHLQMAETCMVILSQKLVGRNLFIYVKGVTFLLEPDKQFSTQVSSADQFSATSRAHDNGGEINNSPAEIKLSARITAIYSAPSSDFQASSFLLLLLSRSLCFSHPPPRSEVKIHPKGDALSFPLSSSCLHTFLISSAKFPPKVCCSSLTRCMKR